MITPPHPPKFINKTVVAQLCETMSPGPQAPAGLDVSLDQHGPGSRTTAAPKKEKAEF